MFHKKYDSRVMFRCTNKYREQLKQIAKEKETSMCELIKYAIKKQFKINHD